jgi:hypothetical protein
MKDLFAQRPVIRRPITELTIHQAIANDPRLAKDDPRYLAMKHAWTESGIIPPIYTTADGQIVDGRHKFWFAQDMQLEEMDCITVTEEEVYTVILTALTGRNHTTKAQTAYLIAPKLKSAFDAGQVRRLDMLKGGGKTKLPAVPTAEDLARKFNINVEYLRQANRLHEAFQSAEKFDFSGDGGGKKKLTLRGYFEPRLLDAEEPMSLGDALKGVGSKLSPNSAGSGQRSKAARNSHLARTLHWWSDARKTGERYEKLKPEEKDEVAKALEKAVQTWPDELLQLVKQRCSFFIKSRANTKPQED